MSVVPSLQLLALLATDPDCIVQAIWEFAEGSSLSSSSDAAEENRSTCSDTKDALRQVLTFASNLRHAVAKEASRRSPNGETGTFGIGQYALIHNLHTVSLAKLPKKRDWPDGFHCDDPTEWTRQQMKRIRRNLIGRVGVVVNLDNMNGVHIVVPPYVPFRVWESCLRSCDGKAFVAPDDTESCYECCRTFPSQVQLLCATREDHGLLFCRSCHFGEQDISYCKGSCLHKIDNLLEKDAGKEMQETCTDKGRPRENLESMDDQRCHLYRAVVFALMGQFDFTVGLTTGLDSWDHLASCVKFSRRLENAAYLYLPEMRQRQPLSCTHCGEISPGLSAFSHNSDCNWPTFSSCQYCEGVILCTPCKEGKKTDEGKCISCSGYFYCPYDRAEYNSVGLTKRTKN